MGTHPIFESDFDCLTDNGIVRQRCKVNPIVKILVITMVQIQTAFDTEWEMFHGCPGCQITFIFMVAMVSLHSKPKNTILVQSNQETLSDLLMIILNNQPQHQNAGKKNLLL